MKFWVEVKAGTRKEEVSELVGKEKKEYKVSVLEPPEKGRANDAVLKALAKYLGVGLFRLRLVSGATSKRKLIALDE
jgi:hypothetical protein